jgi:hypothetical protein
MFWHYGYWTALAFFALGIAIVNMKPGQGPGAGSRNRPSSKAEQKPSDQEAAQPPTLGVIRADTSAGDDVHLFHFSGPVGDKLTAWVEYYVDGQAKPLGINPRSYPPSPDGRFTGRVRLSLQPGDKLSPDGKGKMRWDFNLEATDKSQSAPIATVKDGGWIADPFPAELNTWAYYDGPADKTWKVASDQEVVLWMRTGGKNGASANPQDVPGAAKRHPVVFVLKCRFEPMPDRPKE